MSAEWCNNVEPHAEHYEPMPPGYTDEARVCFGITAPAMSEQTDPLAQLIQKLANDDETTWQEAAEALRAAVLADPTIVGMERDEPDGDWYCEAIACYATVNHDGERCPMHGGSATYVTPRTPEVKG